MENEAYRSQGGEGALGQLSPLPSSLSIYERLVSDALEGRLPHAVMLCGGEGSGALALAVAFARFLLCTGRAGHPAETGLFGPTEPVPPLRHACGHCPACAMTSQLQHPDLHFVFPIYKKGGKPTACDDFLDTWREWLLSDPYGGFPEWITATKADRQQLAIFAEESDAVGRKLSLKSNQGGWKVCLIWLPEKMHPACANKLLKLFEEPPAHTFFLAVSERPEQVLETVRSRLQQINVPPPSDDDVEQALAGRYGVLPAEARRIARGACGNLSAALRAITSGGAQEEDLDLFKDIMRACYGRRVRDMKLWSERLASVGRERQRAFLAYALRMVRENFVHNLSEPSLTHMSEEELAFAGRFAPFINENNILPLTRQLERAWRDIAQNANAKILFFDLALQLTVLIRRPR